MDAQGGINSWWTLLWIYLLLAFFFKADHLITQPNITFIRLFHQGAQVKRSSCSHMIGGMNLLQVKNVCVLPSFYTPFLSFSNTT